MLAPLQTVPAIAALLASAAAAALCWFAELLALCPALVFRPTCDDGSSKSSLYIQSNFMLLQLHSVVCMTVD